MKPHMIIGLALKNMGRHWRRSLLTAGSVAVGLAMFIGMDSLLTGIEEESNRNIVWYETGAAQIIHQDYLAERDRRTLNHAVPEPQRIIAALEAEGLQATSRIVFGGELVVYKDPFPEDGSVQVVAYGINPTSDPDVFRVNEHIERGRNIAAYSHQALMGAWLAEDIGADIGYPVTIVTRTRDGYYQTIDLEIVGIVNTPNPIVNRSGLFMPEDLAAEYLGMQGAATEIAIATDLWDPDHLGTVRSRVEHRIDREIEQAAALSVVDWQELAADAVALAAAKESGSGVILFLVFVIAAVGVSNTVLLSLLERTREIGMLRAMGMRPREIGATVLAEAAAIGLTGGIMGSVIATALVAFLVEVGIDYGSMMRDIDVGYRVTQVIYGAWNPLTFGQALVAGVVLSVLTALMPLRRALAMPITASLRRSA